MSTADTSEKLSRLSSPDLDEVLGLPFRVLDDGFIRVIDYMGTDEAIVQAARVSYGKGTKKVNEDRGLIRYLLRHKHTTPFEMCEIKLHVRVPMDTWRQWIRHRTANVNEYSTRYSVAIDSSQKTSPSEWRKQSSDNKQGSSGFFSPEDGKLLTDQEKEFHNLSQKIYNERIEKGIAREQARKDLPLSTYTEAYWKVDLHNLLHFLALRMDSHAQLEIRQYARTIGEEIVKRWCPIAWEAFQDYVVHSSSLTRMEMEILKEITSGNTESAIQKAIGFGMLNSDRSVKKNREREELEEKLKDLNLNIPW
ncbi:MAG: FAD-dependent thymidylate synthase [Leptospiraceae bacterium]|nr:FAD-dependent thymidylate synthase [Leptospiraceae bacterium]MCP5513055.1 FAD-dependent thymidylate synthase [Leptospiraceae bacterium]